MSAIVNPAVEMQETARGKGWLLKSLIQYDRFYFIGYGKTRDMDLFLSLWKKLRIQAVL
jgi:hypothetical protein